MVAGSAFWGKLYWQSFAIRATAGGGWPEARQPFSLFPIFHPEDIFSEAILFAVPTTKVVRRRGE